MIAERHQSPPSVKKDDYDQYKMRKVQSERIRRRSKSRGSGKTNFIQQILSPLSPVPNKNDSSLSSGLTLSTEMTASPASTAGSRSSSRSITTAGGAGGDTRRKIKKKGTTNNDVKLRAMISSPTSNKNKSDITDTILIMEDILGISERSQHSTGGAAPQVAAGVGARSPPPNLNNNRKSPRTKIRRGNQRQEHFSKRSSLDFKSKQEEPASPRPPSRTVIHNRSNTTGSAIEHFTKRSSIDLITNKNNNKQVLNSPVNSRNKSKTRQQQQQKQRRSPLDKKKKTKMTTRKQTRSESPHRVRAASKKHNGSKVSNPFSSTSPSTTATTKSTRRYSGSDRWQESVGAVNNSSVPSSPFLQQHQHGGAKDYSPPSSTKRVSLGDIVSPLSSPSESGDNGNQQLLRESFATKDIRTSMQVPLLFDEEDEGDNDDAVGAQQSLLSASDAIPKPPTRQSILFGSLSNKLRERRLQRQLSGDVKNTRTQETDDVEISE